MTKRDWRTFVGNAALAAFGAWLCFITVYPTVHDAAVSKNFGTITGSKLVDALLDHDKSFSNLGLPHPLLLGMFCFSLARWPSALISSLVAYLTLKLLFFFVYLSSYRHEALFIVFLLSLHWIVTERGGGRPIDWVSARYVTLAGQWALVSLLLAQSILLLVHPIHYQIIGKPRSRSAEVAALLKQPELSNAIVMGDPDVILEPLPYYVSNPLWFLRKQQFGRIVQYTSNGRNELTLDDILADAKHLHRVSGRKIVILTRLRLEMVPKPRMRVLFAHVTSISPESEQRFRNSTRLLASYPLAATDESYDVFVYPR